MYVCVCVFKQCSFERVRASTCLFIRTYAHFKHSCARVLKNGRVHTSVIICLCVCMCIFMWAYSCVCVLCTRLCVLPWERWRSRVYDAFIMHVCVYLCIVLRVCFGIFIVILCVCACARAHPSVCPYLYEYIGVWMCVWVSKHKDKKYFLFTASNFISGKYNVKGWIIYKKSCSHNVTEPYYFN
jgi:hypothetical protein